MNSFDSRSACANSCHGSVALDSPDCATKRLAQRNSSGSSTAKRGTIQGGNTGLVRTVGQALSQGLGSRQHERIVQREKRLLRHGRPRAARRGNVRTRKIEHEKRPANFPCRRMNTVRRRLAVSSGFLLHWRPAGVVIKLPRDEQHRVTHRFKPHPAAVFAPKQPVIRIHPAKRRPVDTRLLPGF